MSERARSMTAYGALLTSRCCYAQAADVLCTNASSMLPWSMLAACRLATVATIEAFFSNHVIL